MVSIDIGWEDFELSIYDQIGNVCRCVHRLTDVHEHEGKLVGRCKACDQVYYLMYNEGKALRKLNRSREERK